MGSRERSVLSRQDAIEVLIYLLENDSSKKTDLQSVATMHTVENLLPLLENEDLIEIREEFIGRRTYIISLTVKGRKVADQLRKAQLFAEGKYQIEEHEAVSWNTDFEKKTKGLHLEHVNTLEDHVTVGEYKEGKPIRVFNIYVKVNGRGIMRLWCEEDEAFDCIHVKFAWTVPAVQEMYFNQVKSGNVKE